MRQESSKARKESMRVRQEKNRARKESSKRRHESRVVRQETMYLWGVIAIFFSGSFKFVVRIPSVKITLRQNPSPHPAHPQLFTISVKQRFYLHLYDELAAHDTTVKHRTTDVR